MKKYMILSGAGVLILCGILFRILITQDRIGPVITVMNTSFVYTQGQSEDTLLENVSAMDNKDGDVSDSVMVADILPMLEETKAKVTFVVKDSSNNITKKEIIVTYVPVKEQRKDNEDITPKEEGQNSIEDRNYAENKDTKTNQEIESAADNGENSDAIAVNSQEVMNENESIPAQDSSDTKDRNNSLTIDGNISSQSNMDTREDNNSVMKEEEQQQYPKITLTTQEVKLPKGSEFDALSYVANLEDDRDNYYELHKRIHIIGEFDLNKTGSYVLLYYVRDSEDNESAKQYLQIKVQ